MSKKFYITTPIYYVNDKPHIGHAYTMVAADVIARYYRDKGLDTYFLTGTDEHGAKIAAVAEKAGKTPKEFADEYSAKFSYAWDKLNIKTDDFIRTTEPHHEKAVELFLNKLKQSGKVYEGEYEGLYCVGHEAFITEKDLVEGLCPDHKMAPQKLKEKNWFFRLKDFEVKIKEKIVSGEFIIEPEVRKNEVLSFIDQGLEDIAISRPNVKWGIPVPWDKEQTVYVWVDALFNYCSAIGYGVNEEKFKKYWPADVHLMAKDIIKFHCIIWPALLMAIGEEIPRKVFAHGFNTINGQKISKTLGNIIDPNDWVAKYGADAVRYFLMREVPFGQDGDMSEEKLQSRYEGELSNGLGNLVSRVTALVEKYTEDQPIDFENIGPLYDLDRNDPVRVDNLMEEFYFHQALQEIWTAVQYSNEKVDHEKLWELGKTDKIKFLAISKQLLATIKQIAEKIAPFMPETSEKIVKIISATKITKSEPLFPRIS